MVTTTYPSGSRPRVRIIRKSRMPLPQDSEGRYVLTKINSRSAYVRHKYIVGELAFDADEVEIIRHADGTPVLEHEQWPALTPYDTGERLQPHAWVLPDRRRPEEHDHDRYGKVDFDGDDGTTIATAHAERVDGTYVMVIYSHETDTTQRINLFTDQEYVTAKGLIGEVADVIEARGSTAAADLIRNTDPDDDLWTYLGPVIDSIEEDYSVSAAEIEAQDLSQIGTVE